MFQALNYYIALKFLSEGCASDEEDCGDNICVPYDSEATKCGEITQPFLKLKGHICHCTKIADIFFNPSFYFVLFNMNQIAVHPAE